MSQKITSKNLTYDSSLPPFLARLRGQQSAHSGPDPILAAHRRPGQKRTASEEAEDAPVVVDEAGNVVQLRDGLLAGEDSEPGKTEAGDEERGEEAPRGGKADAGPGRDKEREKVAGIGISRKRKAGRVVGEQSDGDDDDSRRRQSSSRKDDRKRDSENDEARVAKASADVRRLLDEGGRGANTDEKPRAREPGSTKEKLAQKPHGEPQPKIKSGKKKTAKKIKLSFGDDGE
ncbi:hypothetical protein F5Y19DRAFT_231029 [Xylariaceae sp. FL1651]|nr:hypothetical protein F5Y19DRAFT_231029 [Xylariaceae sp. FL1651]